MSIGKRERPAAGSTVGALAELPALADFALRPTPPASAAHRPQHGAGGRGRQQRAGAAAAGGGTLPVSGAEEPPSEAPELSTDPAKKGTAQRPAASPAKGSAGKRKRALTPPRSGRRAGPAREGGVGKRRAQAVREGGAGGTDEGAHEPDPTPASIRDLSHLQGFALTARGTLDRLRPSGAHPRRRQVKLSQGLGLNPSLRPAAYAALCGRCACLPAHIVLFLERMHARSVCTLFPIVAVTLPIVALYLWSISSYLLQR